MGSRIPLRAVGDKIGEKIDHGLVGLYIFDRLTDGLSRIGIDLAVWVVFEETVAKTQERPNVQNGYRIAFLRRDEIGRLYEMKDYDVSRRELKARMEKGGRCICLERHERIVATSWALVGCHDQRTLALELEPGDAYCFGAFTDPEHRGKGLMPHLRCGLIQELRREGASRIVSVCRIGNYPAYRFKERYGARRFGTSVYISLFGVYKKSFLFSRSRPRAKELW